MKKDELIIQQLKACVAELERQTGQVPDLTSLSKRLGITVSSLRKTIAQYLLIERAEGTSVFNTSLKQLLAPDTNSTGVEIRDREVRLIGEDGASLGFMPIKEALIKANEEGLDLFLIQPDVNPAVARMMDYGRYRFEQEKQNRERKRQHSVVDLKEITMRYKIAPHDYQVKLRSAIKFLNDGDKVRVVTTLRGRELQHVDMAIALLTRLAGELSGVAVLDNVLIQDGNKVVVTLSPMPKKHKSS